MIALEDLKSMTEQEVLDHLAIEYSDEQEYSDSEDQTDSEQSREKNIQEAKKMLSDYKVLIAYESVGSWGCDSSSFFLLKHKETGELFEINGGHCSCYGFEGQLELEGTTVEALKHRITKGQGVFTLGGYDSDELGNVEKANAYINAL